MERRQTDISALAGWGGDGVDRFPSPTQAIVLTGITGGITLSTEIVRLPTSLFISKEASTAGRRYEKEE
jgi:hypothetical protein